MTIYTSTLFFPNILSYCWNHSVQNKTNTQKILFVQYLTWNFKLCDYSWRVPVLCCLFVFRGEAYCDTGACAAAAGDCDLQRWGCTAGHVQCWPRRGTRRGHSLLGHCHDRAMLQEHPRSPRLSRQLLTCAVTAESRSPGSELPHESPAAAGELSRLTYTPLLPAQAASLLCVQKQHFCLPELPFHVQSLLFSTPAPGTNREPGKDQMSQTKRCLLDAVSDWSEALLQYSSCWLSPQLPTV